MTKKEILAELKKLKETVAANVQNQTMTELDKAETLHEAKEAMGYAKGVIAGISAVYEMIVRWEDF